MRKIAQAGQDVENEQYEAHKVQMELENNIKSQLDNDAIKMLTIKVLS